MSQTLQTSIRSQPPPWWRRLAVCGLVMAVMGPAVFLAGSARAKRETKHVATARIHHQLGGRVSLSTPTPAEFALPSAAAVEAEILSDEMLRRAAANLDALSAALGDTDGSGGNALARLRESLNVEVAERGPDRIHVAVTAGGGRQDVVELVNDLARQYAEKHHTRLEAAARQRYQEARSAASGALQVMEKAKASLDAALEQQVSSPPAVSPAPGPPVPDRRSAAPAPLAQRKQDPPTEVENPDWLELNSRRDSLLRQRSQLLVHRTPRHPEVRQLEMMLVELEDALATIPRYMPAEKPLHGELEGPDLGPEVPDRPWAQAPSIGAKQRAAAARDQHTAVAKQAERAEEIRMLREALDTAQRRHKELAAAESRAWTTYLQVPKVQVELANSAEEIVSSAPTGRLILLALTAALACSVGVGMISLGASVDPPLASLDQVEALLPVPVIGKVSIAGSGELESASRPACGAGGRATLLCGVVLIVACMLVVLRALAGLG